MNFEKWLGTWGSSAACCAGDATMAQVGTRRVAPGRRTGRPWLRDLHLAAAAATAVAGLAAPAHADDSAAGTAQTPWEARRFLGIDGMALEFGDSDSSAADVKLARVSVQWNWGRPLLQALGWNLGGHWDLGVAYWDNDSRRKTHSGLWDLGFTPVFRIQQDVPGSIAPYLEAGVGAHLLSNTSVSEQRSFSTAFQFGSHAGVGLRFGPGHRYEFGYRFQHLSNADIKEPNDGINFHQLRLGYWF